MTRNQNLNGRRRSGFTLVELLVVVSIMAIIAAILVPQLRIVNEDRNIREAGRLVGSLFAQASQRAVNDGVAGVLIERNPNIVDPVDGDFATLADNINYGATTLFLLRRLPNYIGDDGSPAMATQTGNYTVTIARPYEQGALGEQLVVKVNDYISFSHSALKYRIGSIADTSTTAPLSLTLDSENGFLPVVGAGARPFVIHRQPRKLRSSRLDLPDGYLIDLRVSGDVDGFSQLTDAGVDDDVAYIFNARGGIDRVVYTDTAGVQSDKPLGTQYLMVRGLSVDDGGETVDAVLSDPANLWVTVDKTVGSANVVHSQPYDTTQSLTDAQKIQSTREIAIGGQSAAQ